MVDHPKSENMETEDLKTDRNSASDTSADTERIRNSQISGQQELNADDTDRNSLKKRQFFIKRIYDRIRNIFQLIRTKLQNIRRTFGKIKKECVLVEGVYRTSQSDSCQKNLYGNMENFCLSIFFLQG